MNLPFLKSSPGDEPVIVEGVFKTTASNLYSAWTTPEAIKTWFGAGPTGPTSATIDLQKDGQTDILRGNYITVEPDTRLVFTWQHERRFASQESKITPKSLVTLCFKTTDQGVHLRLTHERIEAESGRLGVGEGWNASFTKLQQIIK